jgi:hypothetical protein
MVGNVITMVVAIALNFLKDFFVKIQNAKMEGFHVMAIVCARQIILENFVKLDVITVLSILSQANAFANQIMEDQLVNNVNARILEDVISMADALALNSLKEPFVKNVSVEREELVLMANACARQITLENFVKLDVCKEPSTLEQTNVNAIEIMKDLLVNNAGV